MKRAAAVLAAGLLAACGGGGSGTSDQEAACAREAKDAPAVKELLMKAAGTPYFERNHEEEIRNAEHDATIACLRARGIIRGGGVERPKPR